MWVVLTGMPIEAAPRMTPAEVVSTQKPCTGWSLTKSLPMVLMIRHPPAAVILGAASIGMPVSTTHIITSSILGVGLSKRLTAVNWNVAYRILWAWILTIPASAIVAFITYVTLSPFLGQ